MLYFINPGTTRAARRRVKKAQTKAIPKRIRTRLRAQARAAGSRWFGVNPLDKRPTRRKITRRNHSHTSARFSQKMGRTIGEFVPMAHRRRRRPKTTVSSTPRRRRRSSHRRRVVAFAANPRRRSRRRYRRNPGLPSVRGLAGQIIEGAKDGLTVVGAQVVTRKLAAGLNGMLPATILSGQAAARGILTRVGAAIATSLIARRVAPGRARLATAGAFAEALNFALAQNATAASFLSAYPMRNGAARVAAYPAVAAGARAPSFTRNGKVAAYPIVALPRVVGN